MRSNKNCSNNLDSHSKILTNHSPSSFIRDEKSSMAIGTSRNKNTCNTATESNVELRKAEQEQKETRIEHDHFWSRTNPSGYKFRRYNSLQRLCLADDDDEE